MHIDLKFVTVLGASDSVESNSENHINKLMIACTGMALILS